MSKKKNTIIWTILCITILFSLLIVKIHAQPSGPVNDGPPPQDAYDLRIKAESLASHMISLERESAINQETIITNQVIDLNRLNASPPDGPDEGGKNTREMYKMLQAKQKQIRAQLRTLAKKLNAIPEPAKPRNMMMELKELRDIRIDQAKGINEGFKEIQSLLSSEDADEIPVEDNDNPDEGESTDEEKTPETVKEATDVIGGGRIKTPKHLIEIFERIPTDKTPSANLNYFKRQKM